MDPAATKSYRDSNCNGLVANASVVVGGSGAHLCSSDSFSIMPAPHHELVSANSIELNAAASLSDDSGVPLTTNSSISSGDSYRLGMCKFEIEMVESDGEVSQFDSLDNCSEGGMSAENFNTLKKGPLAPIDPPPEFQDSPKTTLVRSISKNIVNSLRRWTSSQSSFEHLKDYVGKASDVLPNMTVTAAIVATANTHEPTCSLLKKHEHEDFYANNERTLKESYAMNKHLYSSDSILNNHLDNIYDEPNNIISSSLGNSIDVIESSDSSSPLPSPPPPVSIIKIKQTLCPYYQDHTRYFKAIPSEQDCRITHKVAQRFNPAGLSEIHDYDLYYGAKRSLAQQQQQPQQQQYDNSLQRRPLYSPLNHTHHCHYHHHAAVNVSASSNRPNSRNSLNSRLSSSHNSLSVSSANKPDDSIFITQAMSHDALFTREISDFYNVPIDSDIYAFPVDMISESGGGTLGRSAQAAEYNDDLLFEHSKKCPSYQQQQKIQQQQAKSNRRNKRKKRHGAIGVNSGALTSTNETSDECAGEKQQQQQLAGTCKYRTPTSAGAVFHSDASSQEPLHMTLDEVKQFYHTLYADNGAKCTAASLHNVHIRNKTATANGGGVGKSSSETIWSISSATTRSRSNLCTARNKLKHNSNIDSDKINNNNSNNNNNNNNNSSTAQQQQQQSQQQAMNNSQPNQVAASQSEQSVSNAASNSGNAMSIGVTAAGNNSKQAIAVEKKSQFSLNLKQKFCSIFRFRRNHNRYRGGGGGGDHSEEQHAVSEDKRKKFQSRALPPLPKKGQHEPAVAVTTAAVATATLLHTTKHAAVNVGAICLPLPPATTSVAYAISEELEQCEEQQQQQLQQKKPMEPRSLQFTSSIEKVKDYGWYWGPLSSEAAEKVLSNEPDGSFIVRDSSDDHYIFSLSFKLNNCVRHVRIEQDQGTFSFGSYAKFKSQTITEFIEKAVEHSRSGRYLFFLHRRPEHGPMRVQLTNPVSRFKHVQSLQHMCRFVILKAVIRKDLIQTLPLPRRLLDYLNYKHCYSEQVESDSSHSQISGDGSM